VTGANFVQNRQTHGLKNNAGADRLRRFELIENHNARAGAAQQRSEAETRDAAAGDGDIERFCAHSSGLMLSGN
jgi:hypothetical protein